MTDTALPPLAASVVAIDERIEGAPVRGYCRPDFLAVCEVFQQNFARGELGASFSIVRDGVRVVDLWGGFKEPDRVQRWDEHSLAVFFSCSKMAASMVVHRLIEQGDLALDVPLSRYWPELKAGQSGGTLRMALGHTLGLPALSQRLRSGAYNDHDYMAAQLAAQVPLWEPGTQVGYHPITFGFVLGELVRRVTGETLGALFRRWFAEPLGLDIWIGLPEGEFPRLAPIQAYRPSHDDPVSPVAQSSRIIGSVPNLWMFNAGGWTVATVNSPEGLVPEIPAATGVGNARALASLLAVFETPEAYTRCGFSDETVARLEQVSSASHRDRTLLANTRFSLGFMKSIDNRSEPGADNFIIGEQAFGHVGHGGSFGFCDRQAGMAVGYVMNQQGRGILLNDRGQSLIDACYRAVGYRGIRGGAWYRD